MLSSDTVSDHESLLASPPYFFFLLNLNGEGWSGTLHPRETLWTHRSSNFGFLGE